MAVRYPAGYDCPHCLWVLGKNRNMKPFFTSNPDEKQGYFGLTVFDSHGLYEKSFNCVSGTKDARVRDAHKYFNFGSALRGTIDFAKALTERYGYKGKMMISMSSYNNPNVKGKEHPHVWITIDDLEFWKKIDPTGKQGPKKLLGKPYDSDTILELSGEDCKNLVYAADAEHFVVEMLSKKLGYPFNPNREDFFIFINYSDGVFLNGQLATSSVPKVN